MLLGKGKGVARRAGVLPGVDFWQASVGGTTRTGSKWSQNDVEWPFREEKGVARRAGFLPGVDLEDSVHQFSHAFSELLHSMMG